MYNFEFHLPEGFYSSELIARGRRMANARDLQDIASMVHASPDLLRGMAQQPTYKQFEIPKPTGGFRLIEEPSNNLKRAQRSLADHLNGLYYDIMPDCSFGFIPVPDDDFDPRNIYSNAVRHIGKEWVLNVDLKDFFHSVTTEKLQAMFKEPPFKYPDPLTRFMADICTYKGRLPMGAPTSPVLSNLYSMKMDAVLQEYANLRSWNYSRYADDMTFSTNQPISPEEIEQLKQTIESLGFVVNPQKVRLAHIDDGPEVTGLLLTKEKPDVSLDFLQGLRDDAQLYELLLSPRTMERRLMPLKAIKQLRKSVLGQVNFLGLIRGEEDPDYIALKKCLKPGLKRRRV